MYWGPGQRSVAYFLAEHEKGEAEENENHSLRADTVIDGAASLVLSLRETITP
jgi:hypothetical protein